MRVVRERCHSGGEVGVRWADTTEPTRRRCRGVGRDRKRRLCRTGDESWEKMGEDGGEVVIEEGEWWGVVDGGMERRRLRDGGASEGGKWGVEDLRGWRPGAVVGVSRSLDGVHVTG